MALETPVFISADYVAILAEIKSEYETRTGKTLSEFQLEHILIDVFSDREYKIRVGINEAAKQNLIEFSRAPMLDHLAALFGVVRLSEQPAFVDLEFSIVQGHTGVTIPAGTRVQSVDGKVVFSTLDDYDVPAGTYVATVPAVCDTDGVIGNGYDVGSINTILDTLAFVQSVSNSAESAGGSDVESDEALRARVKLAPYQYSSGGSKLAYKFHTLSVSNSIIDAEVVGPDDAGFSVPAGEVHVYPLVSGGVVTPTGIIDAVDSRLNEPEIKAINDTIVVTSPAAEDYDIEVDITTLQVSTAEQQNIKSKIESALLTFTDERASALGRDVTISKIIDECMIDNVYNPDVTSPAADVVVSKSKFAKVGTITVNIVGTNEG